MAFVLSASNEVFQLASMSFGDTRTSFQHRTPEIEAFVLSLVGGIKH